jgi:hypothetical protein
MQGKATLNARELLRLEYGDSRNFMTPHRIAIGKLGRDAAYELSAGEGLEPGSKLYGVSVVRLVDGETQRDYDASGCFSTLEAANAHVERLSSPRCTTCGRPANDGYVNETAGERCVDVVHSFAGKVAGSYTPDSGPASAALTAAVRGEES